MIRTIRRIEPEPMVYQEEEEVVQWLWENQVEQIWDAAKDQQMSMEDAAEQMAEGLIRNGEWKKDEQEETQETMYFNEGGKKEWDEYEEDVRRCIEAEKERKAFEEENEGFQECKADTKKSKRAAKKIRHEQNMRNRWTRAQEHKQKDEDNKKGNERGETAVSLFAYRGVRADGGSQGSRADGSQANGGSQGSRAGGSQRSSWEQILTPATNDEKEKRGKPECLTRPEQKRKIGSKSWNQKRQKGKSHVTHVSSRGQKSS